MDPVNEKPRAKKPPTAEEAREARLSRAVHEGARAVRNACNPVVCSACGDKIHKGDVEAGRAYYATSRGQKIFLCPKCYKGGRP